jgi:hypothetical protein
VGPGNNRAPQPRTQKDELDAANRLQQAHREHIGRLVAIARQGYRPGGSFSARSFDALPPEQKSAYVTGVLNDNGYPQRTIMAAPASTAALPAARPVSAEQPGDLRSSKGTHFQTRENAATSLGMRPELGSYQPVQVERGWVLRRTAGR